MPELPELEALRETLAQRLVGRAPRAAVARQFALVKTYDPPLDALLGQALVGARRHGKHLLLDFDGELTLAVHLGIGGRIVPRAETAKPPRATSLEITLDDGSALCVVELGTKKRSSVHLLRASEVQAHLAPLGVDALSPDLSPAMLEELLALERCQVKGFLTDQHRVAGIGNAYSDEILWEAGVAPLKLTSALKMADVERLHAAIRPVLLRALELARNENYLLVARGDKRGHFQVHRQTGQPCPRCGEPVASVYFAESQLEYCPACQTGGKKYADRRLSRLLR
jgi:formamidopyrimidine-DNA glycosylase